MQKLQGKEEKKIILKGQERTILVRIDDPVEEPGKKESSRPSVQMGTKRG